MFKVLRLRPIAVVLLVSLCLGLILFCTGGGAVPTQAGTYGGLGVAPAAQIVPRPAKTIYLTFDDGPSARTGKILDMLAEEGVSATFFVTGYDYPHAPEMLARTVEEGHAIGLHTYCHIYNKIYRSLEDYLADFEKIDRLVFETTGVKSAIFRFPGGSGNTAMPKWLRQQITAEMDRRGYVWFDWNVVSGDQTATVYAPEVLFENVKKGAGNADSLIVLFHDAPICKTTAEAARLVIQHYKQAGWSFAVLTPDLAPIQFTTVPKKAP